MTALAPLDSLQERYGELLALCDTVESIIDSIAGRMDRSLCVDTAAKISRLKLGQTIEMPPPAHALSPHPDQELPANLAAALQSAASGRSMFPWDAIDAMLRIFLDGLRRHIAAERAMLSAMEQSRTAH
ncbi:MAG TPA: hypothetical protein VD840_02300 [Sinorhizobium sp.]|nr:hypothetical protein [Sinorhizobium sp.]